MNETLSLWESTLNRLKTVLTLHPAVFYAVVVAARSGKPIKDKDLIRVAKIEGLCDSWGQVYDPVPQVVRRFVRGQGSNFRIIEPEEKITHNPFMVSQETLDTLRRLGQL